ncbi:hypothetical protein KZO34_01770 [Marinobacter sp. F4206]|nr:hypothetical protein [Marinobacter sp. F4206]
MTFFAWIALFPVSSIAASPASASAGDSRSDRTTLTVEGISASIGEDNPRVLYILPWQAPSLPRRPRQALEDKAPELVQPVNPVTLEQHRVFRKTLNPLVLSPGRDSAVTTQ